MAGLGNSFDSDEIISDINVTPLVDVALVLLIIFLATSAIILSAAINVELPRSASADEQLPQYVSILIQQEESDEGTVQLFLDGEAITQDQLNARLSETVSTDPETRAMISASGTLQYQRVMDVIDIVRLNGLAGFSLNVQPQVSSE